VLIASFYSKEIKHQGVAFITVFPAELVRGEKKICQISLLVIEISKRNQNLAFARNEKHILYCRVHAKCVASGLEMNVLMIFSSNLHVHISVVCVYNMQLTPTLHYHASIERSSEKR